MAKETSNAHAQQAYNRFSLAQRIEHILLVGSFSLLGLTGIPQKYAGSPISEFLINLLGGIEGIRNIHHIAAMVFMLEIVYHAVVIGYKIFVRHTEMTMLPGLWDITDGLDVLRYNLGLAKSRPKLPRYSFEEKVEYWAMMWGAVVMGLTGFMLWNPISTTRFLPGEIIPTAKAAHGAEAVLAVVAILIWHLYSVHIKTFNKSIFTGKLTAHQMAEEHGEELERLQRGDLRPLPPEPVLRKRERVYLPVALVITIIGVAFVAWFATFEKTAIATLPSPVTQSPAFAPLSATPVPTPVGGINNAKIGTAMKHAVAGMEKCDTCHSPTGVKPAPADHAGRPVESCLVCHQPVSGASAAPAAGQPGLGGAKAIPHSITEATYKDCVACHGQGKLKPGPASHVAFTNESCTICHKPAPPTATPAAGVTAVPAASGPKAIPANHDLTSATYKDCTVCHGPGKLKPSPANHASYTAETCTTCHKAAAPAATPAAGATPPPAAAGPKPIPVNHDLTNATYKDCTVCHGPGKLKPSPANHASYTAGTCATCHKAAAASAAPAAAAPVVSHSVTTDMFKNCATCHGKDGLKPAPANHASYTVETCTTCHQPAAK